jgi:hypothetical protein
MTAPRTKKGDFSWITTHYNVTSYRYLSVAWQHINLFGTFEFSPSTSNVDIDALVVRYADPTYWHQAIQDEAESNLG